MHVLCCGMRLGVCGSPEVDGAVAFRVGGNSAVVSTAEAISRG